FSLLSPTLELEAGATGSVEIGFAPQVRGPRSATIEVRTCADCVAQSVVVRGTGAVSAVEAVPRSVDFGLVSLGNSRVIELELANTGDFPVLVGRAALDAEGTNFTAALDAFPVELGGRERTKIAVTF